MSARGLPTSSWKSVKLEDRTTDYGSALFAFKNVLTGIVFYGSSLTSKQSQNAAAQLLFPFA